MTDGWPNPRAASLLVEHRFAEQQADLGKRRAVTMCDP